MNDKERFEAILIECLEAMDVGETVDQLLTCYPDDAAELGAALRMAVRLRAAGGEGPSPAVQGRARAAFLARAAAMRSAPSQAPRARWLIRPLVSFVTVLALVAVIGGGVLGASATSLPGDPLYSFKRSLEALQLSLARDPVQRLNLEESYNRRRAEEVKAVQASRRAASVQFTASVEAIGKDTWAVGGFTVQVGPDTTVLGAPQVGELVEVIGRTRSDGQIVADHIEVESTEFIGIVQAMDKPMWTIGGRRVLVTAQTQIVGVAQLGAQAEVHTQRFGDSTLLALKIDFQHQDVLTAPELTPTPQPAPSSTPRPVKSPQPTATHEVEHTPEPGPTEQQNDHSTPGPEPTERHDDQSTPQPEHTDDHGGSNSGPSTPEPKPSDDHDG